jgi:hypothetical protein
VIERSDPALLARARAVSGLLELQVSGDGPAVRLDVLLLPEPHALTELLRAVSANGVCVSSVRPQERRPADIFADLVSERPDAG